MKRTTALIGCLLLIWSTMLNLSMELSAQEARPEIDQEVASQIIPIGLVGRNGKRILAEAKINNLTGYVIIDPGMETVLLNLEFFQGKYCGHHVVGATHDQLEVQSVPAEVKIGNLIRKFAHAHIADLSTVSMTGPAVLGYIGWKMFENHEMVVDYVDRTLILHTLNADGDRMQTDEQYALLETMSFDWTRHLISVPVSIGDRQVVMGIDHGAEANLLRPRLAKKSGMEMDTLKHGIINGWGGSKRAYLVNIDEASIGSAYTGNIELWLLPVSNDLPVDGILGYEMLKQFVTSINFQKQEISFYKHADLTAAVDSDHPHAE